MIFSALAQKTRRYYPVCRHKRLIKDKSAYSTSHMQPQPSVAFNFYKITQNIPKCHQETTDKHVFHRCFNRIKGFWTKNSHFEHKKSDSSSYPPLCTPKSIIFTLFQSKTKAKHSTFTPLQRKINSDASIFRRMAIRIRLIARLL